MSELNNDISNKKQRLGRGLGSLLGGAPLADNFSAPNKTEISQVPTVGIQAKTQETQPQIGAEQRVWQVAIDKLSPSQFQPRTHFEKEKLEELAASIKENGILQPIVARRLDNQKLEIIAGERRWRAAQLAGLHEVPVILKTLKNRQALELAIVENIQREDLNAIEEAEAYERLIKEFALTQQQVAEKVGKERTTVANSLRLLALAPEVRKMVIKNEISPGHAKVLLAVADEKEQTHLAKKIREGALSVRQTEKLVKPTHTESEHQVNKASALDSNVTQRLISGLADELQKVLGTKVDISYLNSRGKISVHFYSDDELTQIIERLKSGCGK